MPLPTAQSPTATDERTAFAADDFDAPRAAPPAFRPVPTPAATLDDDEDDLDLEDDDLDEEEDDEEDDDLEFEDDEEDDEDDEDFDEDDED